MCVQQRSVAKIDYDTAKELGVDFKDNDGNYIVGLQLAAELDIEDFEVIAGNYTQSLYDGILPLNPRKPIVRPKPTV